jgi:hypothetical protein
VWELVWAQVPQQLLALAQQSEPEQRQVKGPARLPEVLPPALVQSTVLLRVSVQVLQR